MLAVGALLALLRAAIASPDEALAGVDDETLLVEQALAAGWDRTDPVVRARLVENLRFIGRDGSEQALFDEALGLGMGRVDPVVRSHLAARARRALESVREPSDAELSAFLEANPDRFERDPVLRVALEAAAGGAAGVDPVQIGSVRQLERRLGADLDALSDLEPGASIELELSWGRYEVRLVDRTGGGMPPLAAIRPEVRAAWQEVERARVVEERLVELRRRAAR